MSDFLAAAVQLTSSQDPEKNFNAAEEQIHLAALRGAELVGLPENFAFMGEDVQRLELAPSLAEKCSRFLVTMSRRYQVALLGGGFPVPVGDGSRTLNRAELTRDVCRAIGVSNFIEKHIEELTGKRPQDPQPCRVIPHVNQVMGDRV